MSVSQSWLPWLEKITENEEHEDLGRKEVKEAVTLPSLYVSRYPVSVGHLRV